MADKAKRSELGPVLRDLDDRAEALDQLLFLMDEWLGNGKGRLIEDVIEWRELLAAALGKPERG